MLLDVHFHYFTLKLSVFFHAFCTVHIIQQHFIWIFNYIKGGKYGSFIILNSDNLVKIWIQKTKIPLFDLADFFFQW